MNIAKRDAVVNVNVMPGTDNQNTDIVFKATVKDVTENVTNTTCITTDAVVYLKSMEKYLKMMKVTR